jgi:hypothetical protein
LENDGHTTFIICSVLLQFWSSHILRCTKCFLIGICIICNIIHYWSTLNYYVMIYNFTPLWSHLHINCHCCVSSIKFPVFRSVQISFPSESILFNVCSLIGKQYIFHSWILFNLGVFNHIFLHLFFVHDHCTF